MHKKKNKFTLIEILVVIAIIALLATFLIPAYGKNREKADIIKARADMTKIITALSAYKTEYVDYELINSDATDFTVSWGTLKATLMGSDVATNPRNIQFITEDFDSPWFEGGSDYNGYDYRMKIDANEDGEITLTEGDQNGEVIERDVVAYVKNAELVSTSDDIHSWD